MQFTKQHPCNCLKAEAKIQNPSIVLAIPFKISIKYLTLKQLEHLC